jgi:CheY-like chemotaxis protein
MRERPLVLIADDEKPARELFGELLGGEAYELAFASTGMEALAKATELKPDVILLDVMMPVLDGFEVCRRLRATPAVSEVPVVLITGLNDRDSRLKGIEAGADDFMSKPFDALELRARVRTITRLNRYRGLQSERLKFKWVVEEADDGYVLINQDDEVLYANPQARLYLGFDANLAGSRFKATAESQYRCQPQTSWEQWPSQPADATLTRYLVRPETSAARAFWLEVKVLEQRAGSDVLRLIRLRDVTDKIASEREVRTFQALISHKLRTPLSVLIGGFELLAHDSGSLSPAEVAETARAGLCEAERLNREVVRILQYLECPTLAEPGEGLALGQMEELVARAQGDLQLQPVSLSIPRELRKIPVVISAQAMEAVLLELLENSKKFHPHHSPAVRISVSRCGPGTIGLQVCDDGTSLSPEQLARVWEPYYQGDKYFTGEVSGMGLGLPRVASLLWEAGCSCRLYNRTDSPGVVVELILPEKPNLAPPGTALPQPKLERPAAVSTEASAGSAHSAPASAAPLA